MKVLVKNIMEKSDYVDEIIDFNENREIISYGSYGEQFEVSFAEVMSEYLLDTYIDLDLDVTEEELLAMNDYDLECFVNENYSVLFKNIVW